MSKETYEEFAENILTQVQDKIDLKSGVIQKIAQERRNIGYILDVRWKRNVHLIFQMNRWSRFCLYCVERNGESVSGSYYTRKYDDDFLKSLQKLVNQIENGDYDFKKTKSEQVADIICQRQLTSYMNNTKWKEFVHVMEEEVSIDIPYDYKTLFEEERQQLFFGRCFDCESFNWYDFKSIEWVKVKPKFYESKHRGRLIEDEKIFYDVEEEFVNLMDKYAIPYEYDVEQEVYTIYGYKS